MLWGWRSLTRPSASVTPEPSTFPACSSVTGMPAAGRPSPVSSTWVLRVLIGVRGQGSGGQGSGVEKLLEPQPGDLFLLAGGDGELGAGIVGEPPASERQHLLRRPARGADDVEVPEARFVLPVGLGERAAALVRRRIHAALLARGPGIAPASLRARAAPFPDPQMVRERFLPVGRVERAPDFPGRGEQRLTPPERPSLQDRKSPRLN